ncbi:citrate synthase-like protein [Cantharellus anzutake]|uniref:citrate synthase-like protein n=1 Tax=Cantharellus anzutake TaxID=1750568 RepID=UPI001902CCAA|nr:citrate synthase-like protein [Cantharellus anzutake]KAF8343947.1 citrate synthase-like protein [Cantharellus anzutake]
MPPLIVAARHAIKCSALRTSYRTRYASSLSLKETLAEIIPAKREQLARVRKEYGQTVLGDIKVENVIGGMRGLKALLWEGSLLDPNEGIRFHGLSIPEVQKVLPAARGGKEIIAESMFWLLITGKVPTEEQTRRLSQQLAENGALPQYVKDILDAFPRTLHPMTQLGMGVAALNHDSRFVKAYDRGVLKSEYWTYALEDSLDLLAKLPSLAARIYRNVHRPDLKLPDLDKNQDLVGNYATLLGYGDNDGMKEYLRLYIALHGDHEGGNVSAHTSHLVASALSDPYISYSAALFGLAGPLHGLANQEVLRWILSMKDAVGENASNEQIKDYLWSTLKSGRVIPGYGHGVLRDPDPRFIALQNFCEVRPELQDSPIIQLVKKTSEVAPGVLRQHGKTKNPNPNVDATSGCLLYHYGLTEFNYYTVIFGVSRALGCLAQIVWSRALGLPIERPKSITLGAIEEFAIKA